MFILSQAFIETSKISYGVLNVDIGVIKYRLFAKMWAFTPIFICYSTIKLNEKLKTIS